MCGSRASCPPAAVVAVALMNFAQQVRSQISSAGMIAVAAQPSAYVGSYGDLASPQIGIY